MGTIAEKLEHLAETKKQLKEAIESKGTTVPEGASFRDYVTLTQQINTLQCKQYWGEHNNL